MTTRNSLRAAALAAALILVPPSGTAAEEPAKKRSGLLSKFADNVVDAPSDIECVKSAPVFVPLPADSDSDAEEDALTDHGCWRRRSLGFGLAGSGVGTMFLPYIALRIVSEPAEASVYIEGQLLGSTNIRGMVKKGTLPKLTVRKEGYRDCPFDAERFSGPDESTTGDAEFLCVLEPLEDAE